MNQVSVLMPARNAAATIEEALRSVLAQPGLYEVIVVDDGSSDATRDVLRGIDDPRLLIVEGEGRGIARALNRALSHATGAYVARCDADDRYPPDRLVRQSEWLDSNPNHVAISGGFRSVTAELCPVIELACDGEARDVTALLQAGRPVTHFCTWLTRREAFVAIGGAREWFTTAEDLDLMFRLATQGRVWHDPYLSYEYRLHDASIVHRQSDVRRLFFENCAKVFARERSAGTLDRLDRGDPPLLPVDMGTRTSATVQIAGQLEGAAWVAFGAQCRAHAMRLMCRSIVHAPLRMAAWRGLIIFLFRSSPH